MDSSYSLQGQPPNLHQIQNPTTKSSIICKTCQKSSDNNSAIFCDKCKSAFHSISANVDNSQPQRTWLCQNCSTQQQISFDSPRSVRTSNSSRASHSRIHALELQRLQEETNLEREFIRKKYQILVQANEDDGDMPSVSNSVHEWLNEQQNRTEHHTRSEEQNFNETTYFAYPERTAVSTLPTQPTLSTQPTYDNNVSTATIAQPSSTVNSSIQNTASNCSTFINNPSQNNVYTSRQRINDILNNNSNIEIQTQVQPEPNVPFTGTAFPVHPYVSSPPMDFRYNEPTFHMHPSSTLRSNNLSHQQMNARQTMPKDLPTFTGLPEEWSLFSSTYNWSTNICGLTDAENLVRLQRALRGEAWRSVQHILIHPTCVPAAMSTLKLLYANPKIWKRWVNIKFSEKQNKITACFEVKGLEITIKASGLIIR
ncbi:hypothetical protein CVS40_5800 [Lucilia cuprina]|nr:hypothetical protein CVS40_5800 [Lucilia cuprina]